MIITFFRKISNSHFDVEATYKCLSLSVNQLLTFAVWSLTKQRYSLCFTILSTYLALRTLWSGISNKELMQYDSSYAQLQKIWMQFQTKCHSYQYPFKKLQSNHKENWILPTACIAWWGCLLSAQCSALPKIDFLLARTNRKLASWCTVEIYPVIIHSMVSYF